MKSAIENMANQETELEGLEFVELGDVTRETKGGWGTTWDGGASRRWP